jgi:hypothetical protein
MEEHVRASSAAAQLYYVYGAGCCGSNPVEVILFNRISIMALGAVTDDVSISRIRLSELTL